MSLKDKLLEYNYALYSHLNCQSLKLNIIYRN